MKILLTAITPQRTRAKKSELDTLLADYVSRITHYAPCETLFLLSEDALFEYATKQAARTPVHIILMDSTGKPFTSEAFAAYLNKLRDSGTQLVLFAIGPANGWSEDARLRAKLLFSLGAMTLPHELARVVLAEQIYRACTILAGHPYHSGH